MNSPVTTSITVISFIIAIFLGVLVSEQVFYAQKYYVVLCFSIITAAGVLAGHNYKSADIEFDSHLIKANLLALISEHGSISFKELKSLYKKAHPYSQERSFLSLLYTLIEDKLVIVSGEDLEINPNYTHS